MSSGGRLGTYRYLDMHQAISSALKDWEKMNFRKGGLLRPVTLRSAP